MKSKVAQYIQSRAGKADNYNLYYKAVEIDPYILPAGEAKKRTEDFFNSIVLPKYQKKITKIKNKLSDFFILAANLFSSSKEKPLIIDMNQNFYDHNTALTRFTIFIIRTLLDEGYIELKKGFFDYEGKSSFRSRIWATEKLQQELFYLASPQGFLITDASPLIVMRDSKDKKDISFSKSKISISLEKDVRHINSVNKRFIVSYLDESINKDVKLSTDLHRVFNDTLDYGGRFYTKGANGYQQLRAEDRQNIRINGNKTVELDYSGLHPHLLYAEVGLQLTEDPYEAIMSNYNNIPQCNYKDVRGFAKIALLALLNCKNEIEMVKACNYELFKNHYLHETLQKYGVTAKGILDIFKKAHQPIEHFFCSGKGLKLMRLDSQIALEVMLHFANMKQACLCIHDSFIVEEKNRDVLQAVMADCYQKISASISPDKKLYFCPIKTG
ncbi:hypothetical protein [Desulforegula conservatrix]|uniref:hypothetical protein n=1 Tax=Desulforegula conservatrix TaxID=153026 RepID=UPI0003F546EC|nr:hypothetical protein [Desulforegula conservatrix]